MVDLAGLVSLDDLLRFIREHGDLVYLFAFVFAFARTGLVPPLLAGYAAHRGALDPVWTFSAFAVGSFLGDELRFFLGRRFGPAILRRAPSLQRPVAAVTRVLDAYPSTFIVVYRFARGLRSLAALALGMTSIARLRFSVFNLIGAALWAAVLTGAGYALGHVSEAWLGDIANTASIVLLVVVLVIGWAISQRLAPVR
ncbi:MAG: DedA family protein [Pseudorhodoplanes sp.]